MMLTVASGCWAVGGWGGGLALKVCLSTALPLPKISRVETQQAIIWGKCEFVYLGEPPSKLRIRSSTQLLQGTKGGSSSTRVTVESVCLSLTHTYAHTPSPSPVLPSEATAFLYPKISVPPFPPVQGGHSYSDPCLFVAVRSVGGTHEG